MKNLTLAIVCAFATQTQALYLGAEALTDPNGEEVC